MTARALYVASPLIAHLTDPSERPTVVRWLARRFGRDEDQIEHALHDYPH